MTPEDLENYKKELGIENAYPVIVAGSTHPTEEKVLFDVFNEIIKSYPEARLVIAPRKRRSSFPTISKTSLVSSALLLIILQAPTLLNKAYESLKFCIFGPTKIGLACAAGSSTLCPPCFIKEPPTNTTSPTE